MKSLLTVSAVGMSIAFIVPTIAQDTRPADPQNSPRAQSVPALLDSGKESSVAAAAEARKSGSAALTTSLPAQGITVSSWYKQSVYDLSDNKIGEIVDILLASDGKVSVLILGAGGFLGMGEKDVAVPFDAVKHSFRDGRFYLTLDTTREAVNAAPGLRYDRNTMTWVPEGN
jgi:hypothetical protein